MSKIHSLPSNLVSCAEMMTKVNWKNNWRKMEQSSTRIIPSKNKSNSFYRFHDLCKESDSQKRQHSNIWWFLLKSSIYDTKSWWRFLTNWHNFWYVLEKQYVHTYANARKQAEKSAELVLVSINEMIRSCLWNRIVSGLQNLTKKPWDSSLQILVEH